MQPHLYSHKQLSLQKLEVFGIVQFSHSVMSDSATPWTVACQASLSITNSWSLLKLMSIKSMMPSNHLKLWRPHHLLPSIFPSNNVYSNESVFAISNETKVISMVVIKPEKSKLEKTQVHCLSFFLLLVLWNGIIYPSSYLSSQSIKSYSSLSLG